MNPLTNQMISNDQLVDLAKTNVRRSLEKVEDVANNLTSASLKRVLGMVSHIHLAHSILLSNKKFELNETEQKLIDNIFRLQEDVLGYTELMNEVKSNENNEGEENA